MTNAHRLLGYADTVGKKIGFLVPVFERQNANELFVQRVAGDGSISGFEGVEHIDAEISYIDPVPVDVGSEAVWAFAFGQDDILAGRSDAFRTALANRIDDPALVSRPFLAIEVAEFLNLRARRLDFARSVVRRLTTTNTNAARTWFDISILTPDLRASLARDFPELESAIRKVVATTDNDELVIRGLPRQATAAGGFKVEDIARAVLASLAEVHPGPSPRRIRVLEPKQALPTRTRAIVWLADPKHWEAANYIQDNFEWRVDAFRSEDLDAFRDQAQDVRTNAFAVLRSSAPDRSLRRNVFAERKITRIEFGSLRQLQTRGLDQLSSGTPGAHVYVPSPGFPGTRQSPKAMATAVRQIIASASAIERNIGNDLNEGGWAFFRTVGAGRRPAIDGWAALYDRIWQAGVETNLSYRLDGSHRQNRDVHQLSDRYAHALFPSALPIRDPWLDAEMRNSRTDGAILCFGERRYASDFEAHGKVVETILDYQRWQPRPSEGASRSELTISGGDTLRHVRVYSPGSPSEDNWEIRDMMSGLLRSIDTVTVTCEASARAILSNLYDRRELAVNMRDLCDADPELGIWGLLGAQLRRLSSGVLDRARTQLMALLVDDAFNAGEVRLSEAGALAQALTDPAIGKELHFSWNRVRQTENGPRATVRLIASRQGKIVDPTSDVIPPFLLHLHSWGVAISPN